MPTLQIETGKKATLRHIPRHGPHAPADPVGEGATAADPTVEIIGPNGEEVLAETPATADDATAAVEAVLGSAELATDDELEIGRWYWLATEAGGRGRAVQLVDQTDAAAFILTPATFDDDAAQLLGLELTAELTAEQVGTTVRRGCRVVWRYEIGGVVFVEVDLLDIVPFPFALDLSPVDVEAIDPNFAADLGGWSRALEVAEADVFAWLAGETILPDRVVDRRQLKEAAIWRAMAIRRFDRPDDYARAQAEYEAALRRFASSRSWVAGDDTLSDGDDGRGIPASAGPRRSTRVGNG